MVVESEKEERERRERERVRQRQRQRQRPKGREGKRETVLNNACYRYGGAQGPQSTAELRALRAPPYLYGGAQGPGLTLTGRGFSTVRPPRMRDSPACRRRLATSGRAALTPSGPVARTARAAGQACLGQASDVRHGTMRDACKAASINDEARKASASSELAPGPLPGNVPAGPTRMCGSAAGDRARARAGGARIGPRSAKLHAEARCVRAVRLRAPRDGRSDGAARARGGPGRVGAESGQRLGGSARRARTPRGEPLDAGRWTRAPHAFS